MGLFRRNEKDDNKKLVVDMSDKQRKDQIDRLEEQREDVVRRIEKLMIRISKESKRRSLRERKFPLGDSPNDREIE